MNDDTGDSDGPAQPEPAQPYEDEWHGTMIELGYTWCRPHAEYHRGGECPINEAGQPVDWEGEPW